ncbi:MAG: ketopantoate reductase family protein [Sulfurihydrogenibium sp.]|uniref:ketopantoate reductase family protein n=1 Tax=Sulfurihydrogenibium sp. TaxID=2053621 RepID=UPI003C7AEF88
MKNILIVGLGAVGTVFAVFLKEAGHNVYGLVRNKEKYNCSIFQVDGIWGHHSATLDLVTDNPEDLKNVDFDIIIVSVKSFDTEQAIKNIKDLVKDKTFVILTQNGYGNYETAVKYIPKEKVLLGRVIFGSKVDKNCHATVTVNADDVRIGQPENLTEESKVIELVCTIKHAGIPASYSKEVYKVLWDKILYNCALNPLGALLKRRYGELAENPYTKEIMNEIIKEIFNVCHLNNIQLNFKSAEEYIEFFYSKLIPPTKDHYPSMYYDLNSGNRTEIDALNGAIVKLGEKVGYTPKVNKTIYNLIKSLEK